MVVQNYDFFGETIGYICISIWQLICLLHQTIEN